MFLKLHILNAVISFKYWYTDTCMSETEGHIIHSNNFAEKVKISQMLILFFFFVFSNKKKNRDLKTNYVFCTSTILNPTTPNFWKIKPAIIPSQYPQYMYLVVKKIVSPRQHFYFFLSHIH